MSNFTRRSFVKRTSAVTLGSALGLGILPSVTRKLHATDLSTIANGIKVTYPDSSLVKRYDIGKGELEMGAAISVSAGYGVCTPTAVVHMYRYSVYRESRGGKVYNGTAWEDSYYTWICRSGYPYMQEAVHTNSGTVPIANQSDANDRIGLVSQEVETPGGTNGYVKTKVYLPGVLEGWSPLLKIGPLSYSPACCVVL